LRARWNFGPVQPMRYLHLVYLLMILFAGGFLAHFVLRGRLWRWVLLLLPICVGMFLAQRDLFRRAVMSAGRSQGTQNKWVAAFLWIRSNTPRDVYFALDPRYMSLPGEENYGFRALAERSQIADYSKDAAVVSVAHLSHKRAAASSRARRISKFHAGRFSPLESTISSEHDTARSEQGRFAGYRRL